MDKPAIKKVLAKQIKVITTVETAMAINRWQRSKAFSEMYSMVVWKNSPYKTFRKFIEQEFSDINPGSALLWAMSYNQMRKRYTWAQIQTLAKKISYSRAIRMMHSPANKRKLALNTFIKEAKKCNREYIKTSTKIPNENRITFNLPVLYVEKLEDILVGYGYKIPRSKEDPKIGISDAMVKYLDTV